MQKHEFSMNDIKFLDSQIAILLECKPLPESQVKTLCERVSLIIDCLQHSCLNWLYWLENCCFHTRANIAWWLNFPKRDIFEQLLNFEFLLGKRNPY